MYEFKFGKKYKDLEDYKKFYNTREHVEFTKEEYKTSPEWFERATYTAKHIKKKGTILDIGCQTGIISLFYAFLGYRVVGIDINKNAIDFLNKKKKEWKLDNCEFICTPYEEWKSDERFDYVLAQEIIEHVLEPEKLLKFINNHLRGIAIISTPSFFGKFGIKNIGSEGDHGEHVRVYRINELSDLVGKYGEILEYDMNDILHIVYKNV